MGKAMFQWPAMIGIGAWMAPSRARLSKRNAES